MYINKVVITDIRSVRKFEMNFKEHAGWHVIIGDNGAGKTTVLRSIALALIGTIRIGNLRHNFGGWLRNGAKSGAVKVQIKPDKEYDREYKVPSGIVMEHDFPQYIESNVRLIKDEHNEILIEPDLYLMDRRSPSMYNWTAHNGWFSAGFGAFRKLVGGAEEFLNIYESPQGQQIIPHITLFEDRADVHLSLGWLMTLKLKKLEGKDDIIDSVIALLKSPGLFPDNTKFKDVDSDGIKFVNTEGIEVSIVELSDGFKSILSIALELVRLLIRYHGKTLLSSEVNIFAENSNGETIVIAPGVVLIDEIDSHLHPSWQIFIGKWFTKYFPNIQFIVTTHSPLVCRACEPKGSIWRIVNEESQSASGEIVGIEKEKLISGNILDAYGTELFGKNTVRSAKSNEMLSELGKLSMLSALGKATKEEEEKRIVLSKILSTDDLSAT